MDEDLRAQVDMARLLQASREIRDAVGLPARSGDDELVDRDLAYVNACLKHQGYTEAIEQEHRL